MGGAVLSTCFCSGFLTTALVMIGLAGAVFRCTKGKVFLMIGLAAMVPFLAGSTFLTKPTLAGFLPITFLFGLATGFLAATIFLAACFTAFFAGAFLAGFAAFFLVAILLGFFSNKDF